MRIKTWAKALRTTGLGLILLNVCSTNATMVTVYEQGINPYEIVNIAVSGFYSGGAYAGVNKLLVDGVLTDGFCVDPFHFSSINVENYEMVPLTSAPKAPGTLDVDRAETISKLWSLNYSPDMTAPSAAGLQVAIWEVVGGNRFSISGYDNGAGGLVAAAEAYHGPGANLVGLTGPGQDYVVALVPDSGATLASLGLAIACLVVITRKKPKSNT